MTKVPSGCDNQNLAYIKFVMYYRFRAFPENLKQLSLLLTDIWLLDVTHVIWFGT